MEEKYKHKIITIPNLLSFFRLLLIPVIVWLYVGKRDPLWACILLVLSGVTDIIEDLKKLQQKAEENYIEAKEEN